MNDNISRVVPSFMHIDLSDMRLPNIVVFHSPEDYPDQFVARIFESLPEPMPTDVVMIADNLTEIRNGIPSNFFRLERNPYDHPSVVEVWL